MSGSGRRRRGEKAGFPAQLRQDPVVKPSRLSTQARFRLHQIAALPERTRHRRQPGDEYLHRRAAATAHDARFGGCARRCGTASKQELEQPDEVLAVGVEQSIGAGTTEAARQHVQQQQPQEVGAIDGAGTDLPRAVGVAEGDL